MDELIVRTEQGAMLTADTEEHITALLKAADKIKEEVDNLKAAIMSEMEKKNIIKIETDVLTVTYVGATTKETLDSKTIKTELPDIYDTYAKISPVKASLRIKVK